MYLNHFGFKQKPFQISTDPGFLWLGEKHKEALATLRYGILDNRGFLLLTGDVGTGKTTLIHALVNSLEKNTRVATVPDPDLGLLDFLHFIASAFDMNAAFTSKGEFLIRFREFLIENNRQGKKVLLILDEAQRLSHEQLDEIRVLSNIETQQNKLLNIFFVGQDEFNDTLLENKNRALRQRITINYNIDPLTRAETTEYIRYRLKMAGAENNVFSPAAVSETYCFSKGYPRLINILCDHALLTGYVRGKKTIDSEIVAECTRELRIQPGQTNRQTSAEPAPDALPPPGTIESVRGPGEPSNRPDDANPGGTVGRILDMVKRLPGDKQTELLGLLEQWQAEEQRNHRRTVCLAPIDYASGSRLFRDFIRNLSRGGAFIETREPFAVGQTITLTLDIPNSMDHFKVFGEIVRAEPPGIAVQFRKVTRHQADMIEYIAGSL